jgi:hypothetical protein
VGALRLVLAIPAGAGRVSPRVRAAATLGLDPDGKLLVGGCEVASPLGELHPVGSSWFLLPSADGLLLNGSGPLPLAAIDPGSLLAAGSETWFVTAEWAPEPQDAPPELADRPCPVCGRELKLARVVKCACGRYAHLEDPALPDDPNLLNCHLAGPCGVCGRPPALDPVLIPEPPEQLVGEEVAP